MDIIERIALVIIVVALLLAVARWAYDWGFKSSRNENESLIRENRRLIIKSNLSQENCQRIQDSYSRLIDEMQRMDVDNNRLNTEINKLKQREVYNDYNLSNAIISLNIENKRLKDQESKDKNRIKELEANCDRKYTDIEMLKERKVELERLHCEQAKMLRELTSELNTKNDVISTLKKTLNSMMKEEPKFEGANIEKIESLRKIIKPIEEWLNENACPHDKLIITQGNVEFTSGEFGIPLDIKD